MGCVPALDPSTRESGLLAASSASHAPLPPPAPSELVERPPPGLARGVWEAPPAFFYLAGAGACLAAVAYVLARRGFFARVRARLSRSIRG